MNKILFWNVYFESFWNKIYLRLFPPRVIIRFLCEIPFKLTNTRLTEFSLSVFTTFKRLFH